MSSSRNLALGGAGAVALALVAFSLGRRVEADKAGQTNLSSTPIPSVKSATTPSASAASAPVASSSAPQEPTSPMDPGIVRDLFARLQAERDHRPNLEPTANHVFDLVKAKAGVEVEEQLQVAGWMVGAKFCDKVRSTKDVHIVVCEYADEAAAMKGQKIATNAIARREVLRNKTTTCAVHQAGETPAAAAQAARVKDLFKAM